MATERNFQPPMAFDVSPMDHHPTDVSTRPGQGIVIGMIAGLVGTWVMSRFAMRETHEDSAWREPVSTDGDGPMLERADPVEEFTAGLSRSLLGEDLPENAAPVMSTVVRYLYGALAGALYGAVAGSRPEVTRGLGASFGTATWGFAAALAGEPHATTLDEDSKPPDASAMLPAAMYGITTEMVRRGLEALPRLRHA